MYVPEAYVPEVEIGCALPPWFCSVCHREAERTIYPGSPRSPSYRCCGQHWWPEPVPRRQPDADGWVGPCCIWCGGKHLGIFCERRGG